MRSAVFASSPIDTHTSVYSTFAPFTPSFGFSKTRTSTPFLAATAAASASTCSSGRSSFGAQHTYLTPALAQPIMSEFATLLRPSPTYATVQFFSEPNVSRTVRRSARICVGW